MEIPSTATEEEKTSILKKDNLFMKATVYHNNGNIVKQEGFTEFITIDKNTPIQDVELELDEAKIEPGEIMILNVRVQNNTEVLNGFDYRFFFTQTEIYQQPFKITVNPNSLGGGYLEDEYITDPNFGGSIRMALKGINIITQEENKLASTYDLSRIYLIFDERIGFDNNILDTTTNRWETEDGTTKLNDIFSSGTNKRQRENIKNQFTARFDSDKVPIDDVRMIDDKMKHRTLFDNIVTKYNKNLAEFNNLPEYRYGHTDTYVSNINSDVIKNTDETTTDPSYISQIWMIGGYKMVPETLTIDTETPTNEILVLNTSSNVWEKKVVRNRLKIYDIIEHDVNNFLTCIVENDEDFDIGQDINLYEANGIDIINYDNDNPTTIKIAQKFTFNQSYIDLQVIKLENVKKDKLKSSLDPNKILDYTIDETFYKCNIVNIVTKENNYTVKVFNQYLNEMEENSLLYRETPDDMNEGTLTGEGNKYLITYDNYENEVQTMNYYMANSIHGILKKINIVINSKTHTYLISHGGFNDRDASFNTNIYYNELSEFELGTSKKLDNFAHDIKDIAYHKAVFFEDNMYIFGGINKYLYDTSAVSDIGNGFINNIDTQNISKIDYLNIKNLIDENGKILWKKKDIIKTSKIQQDDISNLLMFGHTANKYRDNYVNQTTNKKNDYIGILGGITSTTKIQNKKNYYGTYDESYKIINNEDDKYNHNNLTKILLVNISSTVWLWDLRYIRSRNDRNITMPNLIFHSSIIYYDKLRKREFMIIYGGIIVDININSGENQLAKFKNNKTIESIERAEINGNIYKIDLLTIIEEQDDIEREFYEFEIIDQASDNVNDRELWKYRFNHSAILNGNSMVVSGGSQVSLNTDENEIIEKKFNDIRVFDLINNQWVEEVSLTLNEYEHEQHENVKLIQHKNYLFATYRSYITGNNDMSNNFIKLNNK